MTKFLLYASVCYALLSSAHAELRWVPSEYPSILDAVSAAAEFDTVLIEPGVYHETVTVPCLTITIGSAFVLSGDTSEVSMVRWYSQGIARHLTAEDCAVRSEIRLAGITLIGNSAGGVVTEGRDLLLSHCRFDSCFSQSGGSLYTMDGNIRLTNCEFVRSSSANGVIFVRAVSCSLSLHKTTLSFGSATVRRLPLILLSESTLLVDSSDISENTDDDSLVIFKLVGNCPTVDVFDSRISQNHFGWLVYQDYFDPPTTFTFKRCIIDSNLVHRAMFGAGYVGAHASFFLEDNIIACNQAVQPGLTLSICVVLDGRVDLQRNVFLRNNWMDIVCIAGGYMRNGSRATRNYFIENSSVEFASLPVIVQLTGNLPGSFEYNVFQSNSVRAVSNFVQWEPPANAVNNYWGDPSGPYNQWLNPAGLGDTVDTLVNFIPFEIDTSFMGEASEEREILPVDFALGFPYPNPFNSSVTIEYALTREQEIAVVIYDLLGREVAKLVSGRQSIGVHQIIWNADNFASGVYFARLSSPDSRQLPMTTKLLLLK